MQNDNEKFKNEFKDRLYKFVLRLIKFLAAIPRNQITVVVVGQALGAARVFWQIILKLEHLVPERNSLYFFSIH